MSREHRRELHNFLLCPKRRADDVWADVLELHDMLKSYGCKVTPWEHPTLLDVGIDIYLGRKNIRLIPTKKGYRIDGFELEGLPKTLSEIVCTIQKFSKTC